jgi:hypothetical protein
MRIVIFTRHLWQRAAYCLKVWTRYVEALTASHAENLEQAYDGVHKFADMQPGREVMLLVTQFDSGFEQWKVT